MMQDYCATLAKKNLHCLVTAIDHYLKMEQKLVDNFDPYQFYTEFGDDDIVTF